MGKRIMLIGADSFIAGNFAADCGVSFEITGASLKQSGIRDEIVLDDLFELSAGDFDGIDAVINFAAIVHRSGIRDQNLYERVNYALPLQIARLAREAGTEHFVQMSTVAVYGRAESISLSTPENPESLYGRSKLNADLELLRMNGDRFRTTVLRPSMVYGGGAAPGNMMKLIELCARPVPLPFRGLDNSRQFAYIGLVTEALGRIIDGNECGTMLLADSRKVSTGELVSIIRSQLGAAGRQFRLPSPARALIKKVRPKLYGKLFGSLLIDSGETYRKLGLRPREGDLEKGIAEMISANPLLQRLRAGD